MLAFAQGGDREIAMNNSGEEGVGAEAADFISHVTEDVGIFAIGISLGLLILPLINRRSTTTHHLVKIDIEHISIGNNKDMQVHRYGKILVICSNEDHDYFLKGVTTTL